MSEKIEQYQEELNYLIESINLNYEKMSRAGNDYYNEIRRYLEKASDYVDAVYDKGLNDVWEYFKKLVAMSHDERVETFGNYGSYTDMFADVAAKDFIKKMKHYEDTHTISRRSIIKTKLDEIKDMFNDPVTNEELIEILEEEGDTDETSI